MDAKAEDTVPASADPAIEKDADDTGPGKAGMTVEERLAAGENVAPPDEPTGDEQPAEDPEKKPAEEEAEPNADDIEGLSAKAQAKVNERIHELNIKRKNAETRAEELETQLKGMTSKLGDDQLQAVTKMGLDPEYVTADEAKTLTRFSNLRAWKKWCRTNRDGYEGAGTKDDPSLTPEQVAERESAIEDELLDIAGPARQLWLERAKLMREDMAAGRNLRLSRAKGPGKPPEPKPPKLPASEGATRRPPVGASRKEKGAFDETEFKAAGAGKDALAKQYDKIFGGGT